MTPSRLLLLCGAMFAGRLGSDRRYDRLSLRRVPRRCEQCTDGFGSWRYRSSQVRECRRRSNVIQLRHGTSGRTKQRRISAPRRQDYRRDDAVAPNDHSWGLLTHPGSFGVSTFGSDGIASKNRFIGNDLRHFASNDADLFFDVNAQNNTEIGFCHSVIDLGTGNTSTCEGAAVLSHAQSSAAPAATRRSNST